MAVGRGAVKWRQKWRSVGASEREYKKEVGASEREYKKEVRAPGRPKERGRPKRDFEVGFFSITRGEIWGRPKRFDNSLRIEYSKEEQRLTSRTNKEKGDDFHF